jgi:hypothetical protein
MKRIESRESVRKKREDEKHNYCGFLFMPAIHIPFSFFSRMTHRLNRSSFSCKCLSTVRSRGRLIITEGRISTTSIQIGSLVSICGNIIPQSIPAQNDTQWHWHHERTHRKRQYMGRNCFFIVTERCRCVQTNK